MTRTDGDFDDDYDDADRREQRERIYWERVDEGRNRAKDRPTDEELRVLSVHLRNDPPICGLCALGFSPFIAEKIMWHQVNGRDPFRCTTI